MCITFFIIGDNLENHNNKTTIPLLLLNNRDEFYDRPTEALSEWSKNNSTNNDSTKDIKIFGGRDLSFGGTWLGVNSKGLFSVILNFRSIKSIVEPKYAKSRGQIAENFLNSSHGSPYQFIKELQSEMELYGPFNVIVGDATTGECYYLCNVSGRDDCSNEIIKINKGVLYGVSNGFIDNEWSKVSRGKSLLNEMNIKSELEKKELSPTLYSRLFSIMNDEEKSYELLPKVFSTEIEYHLSSIFINKVEFANRDYGTRTTSIVTIDNQYNLHIEEKNWQTNDTHKIDYKIDKVLNNKI